MSAAPCRVRRGPCRCAPRRCRPSSRTTAPSLQHLRRQRDDLHEPLLPQLTTYRAEDAGATGIATVTDQHGGVLVEADVGAIRPTTSLGSTDDDGPDDVALLDAGTGQRGLDRADDHVSDAGIAPAGAAEHPDSEDFLGTRVVGDPQAGFLLDHFAFSRICTTRQRFVADSGAVSLSAPP